MKLSEKKGGDFTPHPQTEGKVKAVIVDVTPLKTQQSQYGEREVFKLVYESEVLRDDGTPYLIWSRPYTPSIHEKSSFRKDLESILGRKLTAAERDGFDAEDLIGMGVKVLVDQDERDGKVFSNISKIWADKKDKDNEPLKPTGKYTRVQDRDTQGSPQSAPAAPSKAPAKDERAAWQKVIVHIGKHTGKALGDVDEEGVELLIQKWLPSALKSNKSEDALLIAALTEVQALLSPSDY